MPRMSTPKLRPKPEKIVGFAVESARNTQEYYVECSRNGIFTIIKMNASDVSTSLIYQFWTDVVETCVTYEKKKVFGKATSATEDQLYKKYTTMKTALKKLQSAGIPVNHGLMPANYAGVKQPAFLDSITTITLSDDEEEAAGVGGRAEVDDENVIVLSDDETHDGDAGEVTGAGGAGGVV